MLFKYALNHVVTSGINTSMAFYLRNNSCRPYFIVIQIWVGIIFMNI